MRNVLKGALAAIVASMIFSHGLTPDPKVVIVEKQVYIKIPVSQEEKKQINCLAMNAYFEARDQPDEGVMAVSNVVINRTLDTNKFPNTPCKVIAQKKKGVCQFTWKCHKHHKFLNDVKAWNRVYLLASKVYLNKNIHDPSQGATFYCAKHIHRNIAHNLIPVTRIEKHVFFKIKEIP